MFNVGDKVRVTNKCPAKSIVNNTGVVVSAPSSFYIVKIDGLGEERRLHEVELELVCRYPHIEVDLSEQNGNAYAILGRVARALRGSGISKVEILQFQQEAMRGDYNHLIQTCMRWVTVN